MLSGAKMKHKSSQAQTVHTIRNTLVGRQHRFSDSTNFMSGLIIKLKKKPHIRSKVYKPKLLNVKAARNRGLIHWEIENCFSIRLTSIKWETMVKLHIVRVFTEFFFVMERAYSYMFFIADKNIEGLFSYVRL